MMCVVFVRHALYLECINRLCTIRQMWANGHSHANIRCEGGRGLQQIWTSAFPLFSVRLGLSDWLLLCDAVTTINNKDRENDSVSNSIKKIYNRRWLKNYQRKMNIMNGNCLSFVLYLFVPFLLFVAAGCSTSYDFQLSQWEKVGVPHTTILIDRLETCKKYMKHPCSQHYQPWCWNMGSSKSERMMIQIWRNWNRKRYQSYNTRFVCSERHDIIIQLVIICTYVHT